MLKKILVYFMVCYLLASCVCTRRVDSTVLEYQRQITQLEARISLYESTIGRTVEELESIRGRAENIDGTVDELICLFDDYQRTVERLLFYYRNTAGPTKTETENNSSFDSNIAN